MTETMLVAPAAEVIRRRSPGDPPGDPPGDFGPVLAQAAKAPPDSRRQDGARTATAEGAPPEVATAGGRDPEGVELVPEEGTEGETAGTTAPMGEQAASSTPGSAPAPSAAVEPPVAPTTATESQPGPDVPEPVQDSAATTPVKAPPGEERHEATVAPQADAPALALTGDQGSVPAQAAPDAPPVAETPAVEPPPSSPDRPSDLRSPEAPAAVPGEPAPGSESASSAGPFAVAGTMPEQDGDAASHRHDPPAAGGPRPHERAGATPVASPAGDTPAAPAVDVALETRHGHRAQARPATATPVPPVPAEPAPAAGTSAQPVAAAATPPVAVDERPGEIVALDLPVRGHARLTQLADTARTVIRMAVRNGAAQAHITLHPAELGEVEIRLRYHAGGVSAEVLADSRAAAQALQHASVELRRALEAQGLVVHDLDVRHGPNEERRALHEHRRHGSGRGHRSDHLDQTTIDTSSLPLSAGAVDVLA